jgi:hypothetical protein
MPPNAHPEIDDIDDIEDTDDEYMEEVVPFIIATIAQASQNTERMRNTLLGGKLYVDELLSIAHPQRCWEVLRMTIDTFFALRDWLLAHTSLRSSSREEGVSIEEKLVIFLYIPAHGASNRDSCERFSRSGRTIQRSIS